MAQREWNTPEKHIFDIKLIKYSFHTKNTHLICANAQFHRRFGLERSNFIFALMPSHFQSFFLPLASLTKLFTDSHALSDVRGSVHVVYQGNLFVIAGNGISTVLWIWAINHNCLTMHTYTRLSCDIDPRQIQIDRVGSERHFAFRLLRVAWANMNFQ